VPEDVGDLRVVHGNRDDLEPDGGELARDGERRLIGLRLGFNAEHGDRVRRCQSVPDAGSVTDEIALPIQVIKYTVTHRKPKDYFVPRLPFAARERLNASMS
jgi:hypothetical protein